MIWNTFYLLFKTIIKKSIRGRHHMTCNILWQKKARRKKKKQNKTKTRSGSINALLNSQFQHFMWGVHFSMINSTLLCVGVYSCPKLSEINSSSFRKNYKFQKMYQFLGRLLCKERPYTKKNLGSPVLVYDFGDRPS